MASGMFNSPGMQSMMQQIVSNPELSQALFQSPYMQSAMQSMASNPEMARQVGDSCMVVVVVVPNTFALFSSVVVKLEKISHCIWVIQ